MNATPQEAQLAVKRVLAEVNKEHEAAYRVIFEAVKICIAAGMKRQEAANFLDVQARRIDRRGQYFRSLLATKDLFRSAFPTERGSAADAETVDDLVRRAWNRAEPRLKTTHI
ncbi:hypothetical protein [Arthrobacter sp. U41]|uniref:hypothetical protein n=1 Tax=Arthrobacter sp. U41 TaxID=1849032 RepID=UPI0008592BD4|nr:hypothetical protein [Arthrobacter sp. U41]AOT05824.1 hypothetical protein ASPU41_20575 [Arthrobacter sp. U41]